jgi:outer membrane immunogenic protein
MRTVVTLCLGATALAVAGASSASAADLAVKAPVMKAPPVVVAAYNWTGFYIGAHVGGAWGNKDWVALDVGPLGSHDVDGFLGGGQVGFNWQAPGSNWVLGAEADFSWADLDGSFVDTIFDGNNATKVKWLGTVTGRLGYAWDRALLYVKGGGAWVRDEFTISDNTGFFAQTSNTKWGWTVGVGLEYGFTPNWSAKIEYNYLDFGNERLAFFPNFGGPFDRDVDQQIHVVKGGINYRFGGPVIARY